jgi:two-component system response regulator YesN
VFLVEDEIVVREGIKNSIDWEMNDLYFCGEASDGELAYPMIQKEKPDIVITDIRMPFMDGLELARLLKKEMPWIRIIILSGYGEFEYAKEAINIGITKYLLKPISKAELTKCLITIRDSIITEQHNTYGQTGELQAKGLDLENIIHLNKKKAEEFLRSGKREDIHYFVEEYLKSISNDSRSSLIFRQYIVVDMYCIVAAFTQELGFNKEDIEEPFKDKLQLNMLSSFEQISKYVESIFRHVIELRDNISSSKFNDIINKAKNYINNNYTNEGLSLNQVSNKVYLSATYFSAIFSQKTGQTFIQYLTDLRMNKAKELLKCTDMKSSEIAYAVGYKDPHYFSYLFKKTQNCTPKQYRFN